MNNKQCFIIDDEPIAIRVIENHLSKIPGIEVCGTYTNALKAITDIRVKSPGLLFLDIEMPDISGIDFIKTLNSAPKVIFTTAYRNFAVDAFDVEAIDYVVKPISFERILRAVNRFFDAEKMVEKQSIHTDNEQLLHLKVENKTVRVSLNDVIYIESMDDYIKIHTSTKSYVIYDRLKNMITKLSDRFIRIHRAYIVNMDMISSFNNYQVEISNKKLPIGRTYKQEVIKLLTLR